MLILTIHYTFEWRLKCGSLLISFEDRRYAHYYSGCKGLWLPFYMEKLFISDSLSNLRPISEIALFAGLDDSFRLDGGISIEPSFGSL